MRHFTSTNSLGRRSGIHGAYFEYLASATDAVLFPGRARPVRCKGKAEQGLFLGDHVDELRLAGDRLQPRYCYSLLDPVVLHGAIRHGKRQGRLFMGEQGEP